MRVLLASFLLLAACAPVPRAETAQAAASETIVDAVGFRVSSWGKIVAEWQILPSGAVTYTYSEGPERNAYTLFTKKFEVGPGGFAQIRALLAPAERATAAMPDCGERWTDFPYGSATWHKGLIELALPFDFGCKNPGLVPVHQALQKAQEQMQSWSKDHPVVEQREANS